jgi:gamma-glutamylcyclotransferase (GGCT)/AIG2-like uncharacterized protein YtfP
MPLLFSYGTLQDARVQVATFGRTLRGQRDLLPGFERQLVSVTDPQVVAVSGLSHHANARYTGLGEHRVDGTVLDVTEAELTAADAYERTSGYTRIPVTLASGVRAWVYVHEKDSDRAGGD